MRIVQMLSAPGANGATRHCLMLSQALAAAGHEVLLVHRPSPAVTEAAAGTGVRLLASSLRRQPAELRRVAAALRDFGAALAHSHMSSANAFAAILRLATGLPTVATAHSRRLQLHWALQSRVIAPSPVTAAYHRRVNLVRRGALRMIPNFIADDAFVPRDRGAARQRLGLPQGSFVVGCVGEICARKRQSELVAALAPLAAAGIDWRCVLIGPQRADETAAARAAAAALGVPQRLLLTGPRDDVADLLPGFDAYASASHHEEMPIAVLEAMAAGLPVVAARTGGMPLLVEEGRNGWLAPPGDSAGLGAALLRLATDAPLRQAMGAASAARARAAFSTAAILPQIEAVYGEIAGTGWGR